jgi:hypothetical protein
MGHSNNDTVMYYISGIVGVDSQSMVHGRDQRRELIKENTSMMSKRNFLAPMTPGSQLSNCGSIAKAIKPDNPVSVVTLSQHTPKEAYALQRQSRMVAYCKQREDFFKGKTTSQHAAVPASVSAQATLKPLRSPSRYLQALWKFEPERKAIARLMYPDCNTGAENSKDTDVDSATDKIKIPLKDVLEPMVSLSNPEK